MFQILIALILLGLLLYVVALLPIDPTVKRIANAVVIVFVAIWILGLIFPAVWTGWHPHPGPLR